MLVGFGESAPYDARAREYHLGDYAVRLWYVSEAIRGMIKDVALITAIDFQRCNFGIERKEMKGIP